MGDQSRLWCKGPPGAGFSCRCAVLLLPSRVIKQAASRTEHEKSWHPALLPVCHHPDNQVATGCSWVLQSPATAGAMVGHGRQDSKNCTGLLRPESKTHISCSLHSLSMLCFC